MNHYLLTGATGVIGSAVLKKLIKQGEYVTLLIRADSGAHLKTRVNQLIDFCGFEESDRKYIDAVSADLYSPGLGLDGADFETLTGTITHIVHSAGNVTMSLSYDEALKQTMGMTENMVDLMERGKKTVKMEYVSTVGVAGYTRKGLKEDWISRERSYRNSYEAAKASAEEFIRRKIANGLNITVHRPSMVVGESDTGITINFQVFYYLCEFLSGNGTFGWVPDLNGTCLDLVPSDYVAEIIYWSSLQKKNIPRVLHECSGPDGSIELNYLADKVRTIFREHGRNLPKKRVVPISFFKTLVFIVKQFVTSKTKRKLNTLPVFMAYLKTPQFFINGQTRQLVKPEGIDLPDVNTYLEPVLTYYLKRKYGIVETVR